MKNLTINVLFIILIFVSVTVFSQNTPVPPPTPNSSSVSISSSSTHSYTIDDDGRYKSHSVSVKNHNSVYRFKASFNKVLTEGIKTRLVKEFYDKKISKSTKGSFWKIEKNDEKVFECKLDKGHLKMYLDKNRTSKKFQNKIEKLGEEIKYMISGDNNKEAAKRALLNAQANVNRAKKAYERSLNKLKAVKGK